MTQIFFGLSFTFVTAIIVIGADTILKIAADGGRPVLSSHVLVGCALYAVSALFWLFAMRHVTLAQAGVVYSMLSLLALCAIGALWFEEVLGPREFLGIIFALIAMVLMVRVT